MSDVSKIEKRVAAKFPPGYRAWQESGYCTYSRKNYLWVFEAEWIPLKEIPGYDLWRVTIPGLIPFAFNGAGDHWCFSTACPTANDECEIWFCWHDEEKGLRFAPSFAGWFYRQCLEFASGGMDEDERSIKKARRNLRLWSQRLAEIHSGDWADHLHQLADVEPFYYKHPKLRTNVPMFGFITAMDVDSLVSKQFGKRYLKSEVDWGTFPSRF